MKKYYVRCVPRKTTRNQAPTAKPAFTKATINRAEIVDTIRTNFLYVHEHGGYSLDSLSGLFNQIVPGFGWNRSSVRRFLDDKAATKEGSRVTLSNLAPKSLTAFLRSSILMRDEVQSYLQDAHLLIVQSEARWGTLRPQRQPVVDAIRSNIKYLYDEGGYTLEALAKILKEGLPDYRWDKSAVRRFMIPESRSERSSHAEVNIPKASAENLINCLTVVMRYCECLDVDLKRANHVQGLKI